MMSRRVLLALIMGLMFVCASAVTIDDLRALFYFDAEEISTEATLQKFSDFLTASTDLDEIDEALHLLMTDAPEEGKAWLEAKTQKPDEALKYFYMWFSVQEDALSRINAGRQLTQNFADQVFGYRLMLLGYVENMPFEYYFDEPASIQEMLLADVPLLQYYAQNFRADSYATLAGVLANIYAKDTNMAQTYLDAAWKDKAEWLSFIEDERLQPMADYHELIKYYLSLMLKDKSEDDTLQGRMLSLSTLLLEYYFEDLQDHQACVALDRMSPIFRTSLYNRYIIVSSYYQLQDYVTPETILANYDNIDDSMDFQDAWISFNPTQAKDVFHAVLANSKGYLPTLLMTRFSDDPAFLKEQGRLLVNMDPNRKYGYQLLAEGYLDYFSQNGKDAPDRADWEKALRKDSGLFRSYYLRFMEDPIASETYMLTRVLKNREERAMLIHKRMLDSDSAQNSLTRSEAILAQSGEYDLLMQAKQNRANYYVENGTMDPTEAESYTVGSFLQTFYEAGMYSELTAYVEEFPQWMLYENVQYMAVDSYYYQERYPEVIQSLELMVEEGTIGSTILKSLEGTPISEQPGWKPLLDWAATMPDPQAVSDSLYNSADADTVVSDSYYRDNPAPAEPDYYDDGAYDDNGTGELPEAYPAPDWSLSDAEGNLISLSDLRGKIVILDFWATWCGPCTRTMPLLDEWTRNYLPQNAVVFSINVWEEDREGAIRFMNENQYAMHLLFGTDELTEAYGVGGIPYICLIDEQGMVRFSEIGYNPDLVSVINGWMDTILSE